MELENRLLKMENKIGVLDTNVKLLLGLIQGLKKDLDDRCPPPQTSGSGKTTFITQIPDTRNYPNLTFRPAVTKFVPKTSAVNWAVIKKPQIPPLSISITPTNPATATSKVPAPLVNPVSNKLNRPCPKSKKMPSLIRKINPNHGQGASKELKIISCSTLAKPLPGQTENPLAVRRSRRSTKRNYNVDNDGSNGGESEEEITIKNSFSSFPKVEPQDPEPEYANSNDQFTGNGNNYDDDEYIPSPRGRDSIDSKGSFSSRNRKRTKFSAYSLKVSTDYQFSYKCFICDINFQRKFHQVKHFKEFHENDEVIPKYFDNSKFRLVYDLLSSWRESEVSEEMAGIKKSIPHQNKLKHIAYALATADVDEELAPDTEFINRSLWAWTFENFFVKGSKQQIKSSMDQFNSLYSGGTTFREIIDLALTTTSNVTKDPSVNHIHDGPENEESNEMPEIITSEVNMEIGSPMPQPEFPSSANTDSIDIYEHEFEEFNFEEPSDNIENNSEEAVGSVAKPAE